MKRNTITIIELIIILCVIVVAVRVWGYKKPDISSPIVNRPACTHCGSDSFLIAYYNNLSELVYYNNNRLPSELPLPFELGRCHKVRWCLACLKLSFKCPRCGGEVFPMPPYDTGIPGSAIYIRVICQKCGWYSARGTAMQGKYPLSKPIPKIQ